MKSDLSIDTLYSYFIAVAFLGTKAKMIDFSPGSVLRGILLGKQAP